MAQQFERICGIPWQRIVVCLALLLMLSEGALAVWHDANSPFRRPIRIDIDPSKISGEEIANVKFLVPHPRSEKTDDIHVTTAQGKPVDYRVIFVGPGDQVDLAFLPQKGVADYFVYFGGEKPAANRPTENLGRGGLLMEIKPTGKLPSSGRELQDMYPREQRVMSRRVIGRPYLGNNLIGYRGATMTRLSGKLFAPIDGPYVFAVAANDRGALFIDGKLLVYCRTAVSDTRFQDRIALTRGWHDFEFLHADGGGEYIFAIAWKRPDMDKFDIIGREFFGMVLHASAGPLEQRDKPLTADMTCSYLGEAFFANEYSHRYRFDVATSLRADRMQVNWDFGDGQTANRPQVEHVFLTPGIYQVTVTAKLGSNTDTQKFRLHVDRDYERASNPPTDELGLHAKMAASYKLDTLTPESLARAVQLHMRAGDIDRAHQAAIALAKAKNHPRRDMVHSSLMELREDLMKRKQHARMREVFAAVPADSSLQPWAAIQLANTLMYAVGDFKAAEKAIAPFAAKDITAKRVHGQALLLSGRFDQARDLLTGMSSGGPGERAAALSGAMARTTEFYIEEKDFLAGEDAWEKWMSSFPADFLDGNAALMRVRLIELQGLPEVAARVAEAYANANRESAYSPRLLHLASRLLEKTDKAKSNSLRKLLKERYPEDPLSQEK